MKKRLPLKPNAKIKDVFDYYLNSPEFCRLKAQTQKDYENHLIKASQTIIGTKKLGEYNNQRLNVRMCTDAYEQWIQVGVRTANYRKAAFSSAWKHAMHVVKTVAKEPRRKTWAKSDVKSFLDVAYSDFRYRSIGLIVHMSYEWGQRVGDMRLLKWESLDLEKSVVSFTQSKRNASVILPIGPSLCKMLQVQKDTYDFQEYVTPRIKAQGGGFSPYNKYEVSKLINDLLDEANLDPNLTAMDLRRTAVTEMLEGGVDMAGIMQVTGHKNINSVKPYMVNTLSGASKALSARGNQEDD